MVPHLLIQNIAPDNYSVMARYSNLLPVGILRVMFQLVFVCTYIMPCLCRAPCLAASVTACVVPVSLPCTQCLAALTSCDHLLDGTIVFAPKYCVRSCFLDNSCLRASFVLENCSPANSAVRHLSSNRAVDY